MSQYEAFDTTFMARYQLEELVLPRVRPLLAVVQTNWWLLKLRRDEEGGACWILDTERQREGLVRRAAGELHGLYAGEIWTDVINSLRNQWHLDRFLGTLKAGLRVRELPGRPIPSPDGPPAP